MKLIDTPAKMKQWRRRLGLTQVQAGALLGVGPRMFRRYEKGEYNITRTIALLAAFQASVGGYFSDKK